MEKATVTLGPVDFGMTAVVRSHKVIIDEPLSNGGQDKGPSPANTCVLLLHHVPQPH